MVIAAFLGFVLAASGVSGNQAVFNASSAETPGGTLANAHLVFGALNNLLKSWNTAFAPNGHSVVPATISAGTVLYHTAGGDPPTGLEFLA